MLITLEGIYKDGQIKLLEYPENVSEARVLVTLLPKIEGTPRTPRKIAGLLARKVKLDGTGTDPISAALDELKRERMTHFQHLDKILDTAS